jgi:hypothetical protein
MELTVEALTADPPFLRETEPLTPDDLPLQLALVTMELAQLRRRVSQLEADRDRRNDRGDDAY